MYAIFVAKSITKQKNHKMVKKQNQSALTYFLKVMISVGEWEVFIDGRRQWFDLP